MTGITRFTLVVLSALVFGGCQLLGLENQAISSAALSFRTDDQRYRPGSTVTLRLENNADVPIGCNLCRVTLEERTPAGWQPSAFQREEFCGLFQLVLGEGISTDAPFPLAEELPEGTYRFTSDVEVQPSGQRLRIVSNTFHVVM